MDEKGEIFRAQDGGDWVVLGLYIGQGVGSRKESTIGHKWVVRSLLSHGRACREAYYKRRNMIDMWFWWCSVVLRSINSHGLCSGAGASVGEEREMADNPLCWWPRGAKGAVGAAALHRVGECHGDERRKMREMGHLGTELQEMNKPKGFITWLPQTAFTPFWPCKMIQHYAPTHTSWPKLQ